jgi:hypothetical protein
MSEEPSVASNVHVSHCVSDLSPESSIVVDGGVGGTGINVEY